MKGRGRPVKGSRVSRDGGEEEERLQFRDSVKVLAGKVKRSTASVRGLDRELVGMRSTLAELEEVAADCASLFVVPLFLPCSAWGVVC